MVFRPLAGLLGLLAGAAVAAAQPDFPAEAYPPPGPTVETDPALFGGGGGGPALSRWWLHAEYLLGFTKPTDVPVLASAGPVGTGGILGQPGVRGLFAGRQDFDGISGIRFGGGVWLDPCPAYGVEWSAFFLPRQTVSQVTGATAGQVLARPFFDTALNIENSRVISAPGLFNGSVSSQFNTYFWGVEAGAVLRVLQTSEFSIEQLYHFRHYTLEESLLTEDSSAATGGGVVTFNGRAFAAPASVAVSDFYSIINRWYGGSAGLRLNWTPGRWQFHLTGRLGVGAAERNINVEGTTVLRGVGADQIVRPGFYTASQTPAKFKDYRFSFAPDLQAKVGFRVTDWFSVQAGYQFLYITNLSRAPDLLDRRLNPGLLPSGQNFGAAAPSAPALANIATTDYWMHGLTAGFVITF